jgi:trigger factor
MQVNVEDVNTVKKILHIEVPHEEIVKELDNAYKELNKTAKVKGFRSGKTPRKVLERMYKDDIHSDVTKKIVQSSFFEAIKESDVKFIGEPNINPPELNEDESYKYQAEVELKPEIGEVEFKNINLKKTLYKITDEERDAQVEMLRRNLSTQEPIKEARPVEEEDYVLINFEGFVNGTTHEKTPFTENHVLKLGARKFSEEFDQQMVGMNIGDDKEFEISYTDEEPNQDIAGKKINFKVHLNDIREMVLPDVDDAFAKKLGPFESVEALMEEINKNLNQGYEKRAEQEINEQIFDFFGEKLEFEIPDIMIRFELDNIIAEAEQTYEQSNLTFEQLGITRESLEEQYKDLAVKQVRRHLILDRLVSQEKIEIADDELSKSFQDMADSFKQPIETIKAFYDSNQDKLEYFKQALLEKKALTLILDNADVEDVEPELEEKKETE